MDRGQEATEIERYERPALCDFGTLVEMTAGRLGPRADEAAGAAVPSASPAFGDPELCI